MTGSARSGTDAVVLRSVQGVWPNLPALLIGALALSVAGVIAAIAAPGVNPVSVAMVAVLGTPALAALASCSTAITFGEDVGVRDWARALLRHAGFAVRCGLLAAVPVELLLAALAAWRLRHAAVVLPSVALCAAASVLALLALLAAVPLGITRPDLRGLRLWFTALHVVASRPARFVAVLVVMGTGLWAGIAWTASLLLLVPIPVAIVLAAAVWTSVEELTPATD